MMSKPTIAVLISATLYNIKRLFGVMIDDQFAQPKSNIVFKCWSQFYAPAAEKSPLLNFIAISLA